MNYNHFILQMGMLKSWRDRKDDLEIQIDDIVYQYCGVKGIQYDKESSSNNPYLTDEKLVLLSERLKEPQRELEFAIRAIEQLEPIVYGNLNKLPADIRDIVIKKYWENKTYSEIGKEVGYTQGGLWKRVKNEILKI